MMTEQEYSSAKGIRRSDLFKIKESPEKFKYSMEHPEEPSKALVFGQLLHSIVLEPEDVERSYAVAPNVDRRTTFGKKVYEEFQKNAVGKIVITEEMMDLALSMREALLSNDLARKLLNGDHEKAFFWDDDITGEPCKCKTDVFKEREDKIIIVDLKSAENASTDEFMRSAVGNGYDMQAAMYSKGVEVCTGKKVVFVFLVIEKEPPFAINIFEADELFIRRGYDLFREYIGVYHECKESGEWYGYLGKFNKINMLSLPEYLRKEIE